MFFILLPNTDRLDGVYCQLASKTICSFDYRFLNRPSGLSDYPSLIPIMVFSSMVIFTRRSKCACHMLPGLGSSGPELRITDSVEDEVHLCQALHATA